MRRSIVLGVLLCVLFSATSCFSIPFETTSWPAKGPYLIYEGNPSQMKVLWQLEATIPCTISWGTEPGTLTFQTDYSPINNSFLYEATLSNLDPNTRYYYAVSWNDETAVGSFRSAPNEDSDTVQFLAWSDTQIPDGRFTREIAERMLSFVRDDSTQQTMILHGGDWVPNPFEHEWQRFFGNTFTRQLLALAPMQGAIGNHDTVEWAGSEPDYVPVPFEAYWRYPYQDHRYWSFDYGPVHVAVIDRYAPGMPALPYAGTADTEQMAWLKADLQANTQPWTILLVHEPPCHGDDCDTGGSAYFSYIRQVLRDEWVDLVLCGHWHRHAFFEAHGIPVLAMASASTKTDHSEPLFYVFDAEPNSLSIQAINAAGEVVDTITIDGK